MEDMCEDADCTDDAEFVLKTKDASGKIEEKQLCSDHMKTYAAQAKTDGKTVIDLSAYEGEDDDDDEDEDEEGGEEE